MYAKLKSGRNENNSLSLSVDCCSSKRNNQAMSSDDLKFSWSNDAALKAARNCTGPHDRLLRTEGLKKTNHFCLRPTEWRSRMFQFHAEMLADPESTKHDRKMASALWRTVCSTIKDQDSRPKDCDTRFPSQKKGKQGKRHHKY